MFKVGSKSGMVALCSAVVTHEREKQKGIQNCLLSFFRIAPHSFLGFKRYLFSLIAL